MSEQLALPQIKKPAPEVSVEKIKQLLAALAAESGPQTAEELSVRMFGFASESGKRKVRKIASAARPRVVSFPGSNGYDLWERCRVAEILHGIESLEAQGKDMIREANLYRMAYHRKFRGTAVVETSEGQLL